MTEAGEIKSCCAALYESNFARWLLGESFHPGGLELTARLGELLQLSPQDCVLDAAAGAGASAILLARQFGCSVVGIDLSAEQVNRANAAVQAAGVAGRVRFERADAEQAAFESGSFDAVICECAFCTFPDKGLAAAQCARILKSRGRIGIADLTRSGPLPRELEGLLAWIACIADARPVSEYAAYLEAAGFADVSIESHDQALSQMVHDIQSKLLASQLLLNLKQLDLPGVDLGQAKRLARSAADAINNGLLGYSLIVARRAECR